MAWVCVGIGSNIEPERNIRSALAELRRRFGALTVSTIYANPAIGFAGDDFLNLVVKFDTDLPVRALAAQLREIETGYPPRGGEAKFVSRALDLDLLLYGEQCIVTPELTVPHPGLGVRAFVLYPLFEIAPDLIVPGMGLISDLVAKCPLDGLKRVQ